MSQDLVRRILEKPRTKDGIRLSEDIMPIGKEGSLSIYNYKGSTILIDEDEIDNKYVAEASADTLIILNRAVRLLIRSGYRKVAK